jgi:hypothetical protein
MKLAIKVNGQTEFYSAINVGHESAREMVIERVRQDNPLPSDRIGACLALVVDNTQHQKAAA